MTRLLASAENEGPKTSKTSQNLVLATTKLTESQMVLLNAASRREDRCLTPMSSLRGAQLVKTREKLIAAGLVREI